MKYIKLSNGAKMPIVGYGTWLAVGDELELALNEALKCGYRHFDTAYGYENQCVIGKVLNEWISSGKVTRDELFVISKIPAYGNRPQDVEKYLKLSLQEFRLEYVDLYMIHLPIGLIRDTQGRSAYHEMEIDYNVDHLNIWKEMEKQVDCGWAKAIGLSNFNVAQAQRILNNCRIKPANLQVELHLYLQQPELVGFCKKNDIAVTSYSTLGMKVGRALFGMSWTRTDLPEMLENEVLAHIAEKHKKTPAQTLLRFITQKGVSIIPKSTNPLRIAQNIQIFDFELDSDDVDALNRQDAGEGGRIVRFLFIKGVIDHPEYPFPKQP